MNLRNGTKFGPATMDGMQKDGLVDAYDNAMAAGLMLLNITF
jgi:hypothetical protein